MINSTHTLAVIQHLQGQYSADHDTVENAPRIFWADYEILTVLFKMSNQIQDLQNQIINLEREK